MWNWRENGLMCKWFCTTGLPLPNSCSFMHFPCHTCNLWGRPQHMTTHPKSPFCPIVKDLFTIFFCFFPPESATGLVSSQEEVVGHLGGCSSQAARPEATAARELLSGWRAPIGLEPALEAVGGGTNLACVERKHLKCISNHPK